MKWLIDAIITLLTFKRYRIGNEVFRAPAGWKLSCLAKTRYGLFVGIYRCHDIRPPMETRLYLDGVLIDEDRNGNETIGNPCVFEGQVFFVGERNRVWAWRGDGLQALRRVDYATHVGVHRGKPVLFDTSGGRIACYNVLNNLKICDIPGSGIVTASAPYGDTIIAASCDGGGGFGGSDGRFIPCKDALCLCGYNGQLYGSRGNEVVRVEWDKQRLMSIETLPGKITDMQAVDGKLFVTCAGPDQLWVMDRLEDCSMISDLGGKPIGGSVFHSRVTDGFYGRSENNKTAVVYEVL